MEKSCRFGDISLGSKVKYKGITWTVVLKGCGRVLLRADVDVPQEVVVENGWDNFDRDLFEEMLKNQEGELK